jgi:glycosyltransferase involved in cell wall biosynthesis
MKIGIDAKWYFEGPPSGKRVIRNLVDCILRIDNQNEYVIFLNKKHSAEQFSLRNKANVKLCYVWASNNALSNIFVLPFFSNRHKLDATLYQTFISPFDKAKKIAYIHDVLFLSNPEYYTWPERLYFAPLKFLTKWASAIITVSEEEKKRLIRFKYSKDPEKIVVAYHGVDQTFAPAEQHSPHEVEIIKHKFSLPDKFILFVGRLNLRKNVDNLLRAIPLLKNKTISLVIVGADNWKKSNHEVIVKELGIEERIDFKGGVYKDLDIIYSLATVFCFPSHAESFGLPPLEAMASGVPVIISNTTSLPEICGAAGTYIDPLRPDQIADAIDNLLINDQLYEEKKRLGLERAKTFTWEAASKTIINCLKSCINNKPA